MHTQSGAKRKPRRIRKRPEYSNHGKPWPSQQWAKDALSSLVNWYTVDEISRLLGRTPESVRGMLHKVGVKVRWRRNHKGIARIWQDKEKESLLDRCSRQTRKKAAEELGVSVYSLNSRCILSGIKWDQGYFTLSDIARVAGCSQQAVASKVSLAFPRKISVGNGRGTRYRLTIEQAEALMAKVRPGRIPYLYKLFD